MKIRFLQSIAAVDWDARPGEVLDMPEDEALRLIHAEIATPAETRETTALDAPETRAKKTR